MKNVSFEDVKGAATSKGAKVVYAAIGLIVVFVLLNRMFS